MAIATINRFVATFDAAFQALAVRVDMAEIERMAMVVHYAMESKTRAYHTSGHVFAMCQGMQPRQVLAALFHDLVYYQLDGGFPEHAAGLLAGVTQLHQGALVLQPIAPEDTALQLCADLFDFHPGQALPLYAGLNEFLSAVVAARTLHAHLDLVDLIGVVACIEATIPFRTADAQGRSAIERLASRVQQQCQHRCPQLDAPEVHSRAELMMAEAVTLSNRDVGSFGEADPGLFLANTWLLIEESNAPLTKAGRYTLQEYRSGLARMDGFLRGLEPVHIFQHYDGQPPAPEMAALCATAGRNIAFACDFLGAKITSIAIIEALARCTGTDGPVSMFLGDIRSGDGKPDRIEDFLPPAPRHLQLNADLLRVFEKGRSRESSNDLTTSPLTAFMYCHLGHAGTLTALGRAHQMFDGVLSPLAFLQSLDRSMVQAIIQACARIALSRRTALLALAQTFQDSAP